jgi:hypothetical protein
MARNVDGSTNKKVSASVLVVCAVAFILVSMHDLHLE